MASDSNCLLSFALLAALLVSATAKTEKKHSWKSPQMRCKDAMNESLNEAERAISYISKEAKGKPFDKKQKRVLSDCKELLELSSDLLKECVTALSTTKGQRPWDRRDAIYYRTWASAALTYEVTCTDAMSEANMDKSKYAFTQCLSNSSRFCKDSLRIMNEVPIHHKGHHSRRLLSTTAREFPSWMSASDRRHLLQTTASDAVDADGVITVAKDGSGNFSTVSAAISAVPSKSKNRTIIYVKAGVYRENVEVPKSKTNIMLIGDGIDATVITANRSVVDGWTTFKSATFAAVGQGFMARDITFENSAGPQKHQAVALRVGSDRSAFYRCSFKGYQDTLYAHSLRQFYRECDIYGTVDFIFGNAAVVFQKCNLLARKPMANQKIALTAQGRTDPNQNTGTSILNCNVSAATDLAPVKSSFQSYLGRPWKAYSRTVYLESFLDDLLQPSGWLAWSGDFALKTLYYGEYNNKGPGSSTANRVKWPGYHVMNASDARNFTVTNFIAGDLWLSDTNVPFDSGL